MNHDYCQTCSYKSRLIGSGGSGERTRFLERSPRTLKAAEGHMLVQTSSSLHHCSSDPSNSLPPGVLQPKTYPPSERPVKHPSWSPRQYTFWNCLHLCWYWAPGNCCKPATAPSHRSRRLREVLQLTPASLSLELPTPPLDRDTAGHPNQALSHPSHAPSTGALATIARFANVMYPWTIPYAAPPGHTYQQQPPQFLFILAGDSNPIPVRGMPQTQQPSTHAAPPPTCSPMFLSCCSRPTLPTPISPMGGTSGFVPQPPHLQPPPSNRTHPSSKGKRKRSFADHQYIHQRHPEVLRQPFPRIFIGNPK